jgi:transposase InsO family protein
VRQRLSFSNILNESIREVDLSEYIGYHDAYQPLGRFLDDVSMRKRIHSSLGYLTPAEFEEQWRKEQELALVGEIKYMYLPYIRK